MLTETLCGWRRHCRCSVWWSCRQEYRTVHSLTESSVEVASATIHSSHEKKNSVNSTLIVEMLVDWTDTTMWVVFQIFWIIYHRYGLPYLMNPGSWEYAFRSTLFDAQADILLWLHTCARCAYVINIADWSADTCFTSTGSLNQIHSTLFFIFHLFLCFVLQFLRRTSQWRIPHFLFAHFFTVVYLRGFIAVSVHTKFELAAVVFLRAVCSQ